MGTYPVWHVNSFGSCSSKAEYLPLTRSIGLISAGIIPTLANTAYTPPELAHQLKDSKADYVFVHPSLVRVLKKAYLLLGVSEVEAKKRVIIMTFTGADRAEEEAAKIDDGWIRLDELFQKGKLNQEIILSGQETDETALMCYSSGKRFIFSMHN